MDLINISGLSLSDRKYMSFGQEGMPNSLGSPVFQLAGGVFTTGGFTYSHLDSVPFHFTSDGKLMTDTELEVSGVVIGNVKVFSTDNTAPNALYGRVDSRGVLETWQSGGKVFVTSGVNLTGSMYIPAGSVIVTQGRDLVGSMYVPAGSVIVTQARDVIGSMYIPAGSVIVTQGRDLIGSMYIPAGSVIVTSGRDLVGSMYIPAGSVIVTNSLPLHEVYVSGTITIGSVSVHVDEITMISGNCFITSGVNLLGSMYIPAGSVICTQGRDLIGSMYIPAGSMICTQGRDLIGSMYVPAGSVIVTNKVEVSGLNYGYVIPSGTFILGSQTTYNNVVNKLEVSGLNYNYAIPSGTFYTTAAQSGTYYNTISPSGTFYATIAPSGTFILGSQTTYNNVVQGRDLIGSMYIPAGSVIVTNVIGISGAATIFGGRTDNSQYLANGSTFMAVGGFYESSPTAITAGNAGTLGLTQYREVKVGGYDTATNSISVTETSPALTQVTNLVLINAVGSQTGSIYSATINCNNYREKAFYFQYTNGGTGSTMTAVIQASPDASTWFTIGSHAYTETNALDIDVNDDPHTYVKVYTEAQNGGTLSAWLTARGG